MAYSENDFNTVKQEIQQKLSEPEFVQKLKQTVRERNLNIQDIQKQPHKIIALMNEFNLIGGSVSKVHIQKQEQKRQIQQQRAQTINKKEISN